MFQNKKSANYRESFKQNSSILVKAGKRLKTIEGKQE